MFNKNKFIYLTLVLSLLFSFAVSAEENNTRGRVNVESDADVRVELYDEETDGRDREDYIEDSDERERVIEEDRETRIMPDRGSVEYSGEARIDAEVQSERREQGNEAQNVVPVRATENEPTRGGVVPTRDRDDQDEDIEPKAKNYNSSRSNRRKNVFDNRDDLPEAIMRAGVFVSADNGESEVDASAEAGIRDDNALYCWGRAETEDGEEFRWGRGLCVALNAVPEENVEARSRIEALQLRAEEIRAWSDQERDDWNEFRRRGQGEAEEIIGSIIDKIQSDERIREIRTGSGAAEVRYQARMRLLGFIPVDREVIARVDAEGRTQIDYPWYRFLSRRPDTGTIRDLLNLARADAETEIEADVEVEA